MVQVKIQIKCNVNSELGFVRCDFMNEFLPFPHSNCIYYYIRCVNILNKRHAQLWAQKDIVLKPRRQEWNNILLLVIGQRFIDYTFQCFRFSARVDESAKMGDENKPENEGDKKVVHVYPLIKV